MSTPRTMVMAVLVLVAALPATSFSADLSQRPLQRAHPFTLVNATLDSVTGVAMAPASSDAFEEIALGEALRGGRASATVDLPAGDCLRDVRVTFLHGRSQVFPSVDVCRSRTLRLATQRQPAAAGGEGQLLSAGSP